jgi:hypothetical protein
MLTGHESVSWLAKPAATRRRQHEPIAWLEDAAKFWIDRFAVDGDLAEASGRTSGETLGRAVDP